MTTWWCPSSMLCHGRTEQERLVVALYYYEELTLKEIGQVLELSESRVSQLHTKAVLSLRVKLRKRFMA